MTLGVARALLAGVLLAAAAFKLSAPDRSRTALETFGVHAKALQSAIVAMVVVAEVALAAGVAAGLQAAAYGAAALLTGFAAALAWALLRERRGAPCGCLGGGSRVTPAAVARNLLLAGSLAALPWADGPAGALVLATTVGGVALVLGSSLRRAPARDGRAEALGALEIPEEGPALAAHSPLAAHFDAAGADRLLLAVFVSERCRVCRELEPAIGALAEHPLVYARTFDEQHDADVWRAAEIPGSPYAVALDGDGTTLAKGTFNTAAQLESVLGAAERRRAQSGRRLREGAPAAGLSRRTLLARAGQAMVAVGAGGAAAALVKPGEAEAFHFCGHTFTTGSCPHPTGLPRVDIRGYPLRARDGKPVDDLGRLVDGAGRPIDERGFVLLDPDGRPLPPASRSRLCTELTARRYSLHTHVDGSWYRCCGGHVRKLIDCCAHISRRINGDAALTGYCRQGRKVFCVHYYDTRVPC